MCGNMNKVTKSSNEVQKLKQRERDCIFMIKSKLHPLKNIIKTSIYLIIYVFEIFSYILRDYVINVFSWLKIMRKFVFKLKMKQKKT